MRKKPSSLPNIPIQRYTLWRGNGVSNSAPCITVTLDCNAKHRRLLDRFADSLGIRLDPIEYRYPQIESSGKIRRVFAADNTKPDRSRLTKFGQSVEQYPIKWIASGDGPDLEKFLDSWFFTKLGATAEQTGGALRIAQTSTGGGEISAMHKRARVDARLQKWQNTDLASVGKADRFFENWRVIDADTVDKAIEIFANGRTLHIIDKGKFCFSDNLDRWYTIKNVDGKSFAIK